MRRFFIIFAVMFFSHQFANATIDDNLDYNFINNAFTEKPVTNQEFENLMQQYEKKHEGFFQKMYKFFDRDKVKYDEAFKKKYENANNQPVRIKDTPEDKPTVLISVDSFDSNGNEVKVGYYQVEIKKEEGKYYLNLCQGGNKSIATLIAHQIDEDEKAPSIVYGRAEATNNGYIKIIYANLDVTLLGYLKVKEEEKTEYEPIY